jgi:hypothetical protein
MPDLYYRLSDPTDIRDLGEQVAAWTAAGNPKADDWAPMPPEPTYDPGTQQAPQWIDGQWIIEPLEILSKRWPDAEAFVAEFTLPEMAAIGLSTDPIIAALRFLLSSWRSQVISDDPRVQAGMDALVQTGVLTEDRRVEILS